jgi:hypothetical protein
MRVHETHEGHEKQRIPFVSFVSFVCFVDTLLSEFLNSAFCRDLRM